MRRIQYTGLLILVFFFIAGCKKAVIRIDSVPENTPRNQPIYIAGNFNNWDPGDERYRMEANPDGSYTINLPPGFGTVEYKFTRGDWTTVETDLCGYPIGNRTFRLGDLDTVGNRIESWNDLDPLNCPRLTLVLENIPGNTPPEDLIAVAGNFNAWNPDENAVMQRDSSGKLLLTVPRLPGIQELEFKITRGDLASAESDEFGNVIPNRKVYFGSKDTVTVSVEGWIDRPSDQSGRVIFILKNLPKSTRPGDEFFLISNMNYWTAGDRNYIFQKNKDGQYFFPFPRKKNLLEFKITRGDWSTVEVDRFGYEIQNRSVNLREADTVYLSIGGWKDRDFPHDYELTILIGHLPETTPANAPIYLAGDLNGWNPERNKQRFERNAGNQYFLNVPRGPHGFGYKITRGSWRTVEVDQYGSEIPNRFLKFQDADTVVIDIENWKDLPLHTIANVTLVIDRLPEETPPGALYLAPDFNDWNPGDPKLIFGRLPDGKPCITIPAGKGSMEYKITRGSWNTVEVNETGFDIPNRILAFGFADTVYIQVIAWRDVLGAF